MAASDKAKRIAMMLVGGPRGAMPGGPRGSAPTGDATDDSDAPPDDGEDGDLEEAMGGLRDAMRSGDDAAAAAAFRAAVQAVG